MRPILVLASSQKLTVASEVARLSAFVITGSEHLMSHGDFQLAEVFDM